MTREELLQYSGYNQDLAYETLKAYTDFGWRVEDLELQHEVLRLRRCKHCKCAEWRHIDGKCLFMATRYVNELTDLHWMVPAGTLP